MKLINYLKNMPGGQKRAGKLLAGFFSLVLVFTLVSRGLDSFSIATVSTAAPNYGGLSRKITVSGTIQPLTEFAVSVPDGFLVRQTMVTPGTKVEEGDVLAILDLDSIQQQLADARRELERAQLGAAKGQGSKIDITESDPYADAELALQRAKEDLALILRANQENVARARSDLAETRFKRNDLYTNDIDSDTIDAARKEVEQAERVYEDAVKAAEQSELSARRVVEDAERKFQQIDEDQRKEEQTKAADEESKELDNRLNMLSVEEVQQKIARLQALVETEGLIKADQGGIVTKVNIETGTITSSGGAFILAESDGGSIFEGTVDEANGKLLSIGDKVEMTLPGISSVVSATVDALAPPKEKGGEYTVTVKLPEHTLDPGVSATAVAEKKSGREGSLIPLSALHSENNSDTTGYVYVLREKNTTMGEQTVVEKLSVEIIDKNDQTALVDGPLSRQDKIVTGSSRSIENGDRVRDA